jgi:hypothetical protein
MEDVYDDSGSFDITSDDVVVGDFSKNVVERAAAAKFTIEQYYHNFFRSEKEREGRYPPHLDPAPAVPPTTNSFIFV